jgi:hypothetical protein
MFNEALDKAAHTYIKEGELQMDPSTKIRKTEFAQAGYNGEPQPSLGEALMYHLKQNAAFGSLTPQQMKLVHWHIANLVS